MRHTNARNLAAELRAALDPDSVRRERLEILEGNHRVDTFNRDGQVAYYTVRTMHAFGLGPFGVEGSAISFDELVDGVIEEAPGLTRAYVVLCLARYIYEGEEDWTAGLTLPAEWVKAFEARDELRRINAAIPEETIVRWGRMEDEGTPEATKRKHAEWTEHGLTAELIFKALGPDVDEIDQEEAQRRYLEIFEENYTGERGYKIVEQYEQMIGVE